MNHKRNLEISRKLLLRAEAMPFEGSDDLFCPFIDLEPAPTEVEAYHLVLLRGAGFIEGKHAEYGTFRITNVGHDYMDTVRDEEAWRKTKTLVGAAGTSTLSIVADVAKSIASGKIAAALTAALASYSV